MKNYAISIYFDTRRAKKNGKYPVKLRVFTSEPKKQKLYPLGIDLTKAEFRSAWETSKPRKEFKDMRLQLLAIETKANKMADRISPFSFRAFENAFINPGGTDEKNVNHYYLQAINDFRANEQIGSASNYDLSLKSLLRFHGSDSLPFIIITPQWLKDFESYMTKSLGLSPTTVGMYLRPLRAVFNTAIEKKAISKDIYPFGKRRYTIPEPRGLKKALSRDQLRLLFKGKPRNKDQAKAKAFWFFSYVCNGMNMVDILNLKVRDIHGETLTFNRTKTAKTNKSQAPVIVYLQDYSKSVIAQYGNLDADPDSFIFPVLEQGNSAQERLRLIQNFVRYVNQHFRNYALSLGIDEKISTYWARHTFATMAVQSGSSLELVSEALSHANLRTTQTYFAGFENEEKKSLSRKLLDFE